MNDMIKKRYSRSVEKELKRLADLADQRSNENRLEMIFTLVGRWKDGKISAVDTIKEVHQMTATESHSWSEDADPGVPVAHAIVQGILKRKDFDEKTWRSIAYLVTLAEL